MIHSGHRITWHVCILDPGTWYRDTDTSLPSPARHWPSSSPRSIMTVLRYIITGQISNITSLLHYISQIAISILAILLLCKKTPRNKTFFAAIINPYLHYVQKSTFSFTIISYCSVHLLSRNLLLKFINTNNN